MFNNIGEFLSDEIILLGLLSIFFSLSFFRLKIKWLKKLLVIVIIVLLIDFINMSLIFWSLNTIDNSKIKFHHYAIQTEIDTISPVLYTRVFVSPYFDKEDKLLYEFNFITKFYSKFLFNTKERFLTPNELKRIINDKLPIIYEDSSGSIIYASLKKDTLYLKAKLNIPFNIDSLNYAAAEAEDFLNFHSDSYFVKNSFNFEFIDSNMIDKNVLRVRTEDLLFTENIESVNNPFIKTWNRLIAYP